MADLSRKTASIYINHQPAEDALKALQKQADTLTEKIKKGGDAGKGMVKEISNLNKVQDDIAKVQKQIDSGLRPSFNQVQTTVAKLRNELKRMSEDAPGYADKFKAYQKASLEMQRLGESVNKVGAAQGKLNQFFSGFGSAFAIGGIAAAGAALVGFFSDAIGEAAAAEEASIRLQTTLDNLGKSDAFDRITSQSDRLAESLGYLDNDDINGVFEKLLTYGKLTEAQMSQLTPIILDFSAKTRTSLPEASDTIIKALEGNGKALKTFGIDLKDAKTEEERFSIVTTELAGKVEGAAEAFKGTFAGSVATAKQDVANLKEEIGTGLMPAMKFLLGVVSGLIDGIGNFGNGIVKVWDQIKNLRSGWEQQRMDEAQAQVDFIKKSGASLVEDFIQKPIEAQRKQLKQTADILEFVADKYRAALKVGSGKTKEEIETLRINFENYRQNTALLINAFKNTKKEADDKASADSLAANEKKTKQDEENHKKYLADLKRRGEEANRLREQLEKEWEALQKSISSQTDKLFLTSLELSVKNIEDQNALQLAKLKELFDKKIIDQEQYNAASFQLERIRVRSIIDINKPDKSAIDAVKAIGAKITGASGPSQGARGAAEGAGDLPDGKINPFPDKEEILAGAQFVLDKAQSVFDIVQSFNAAADARDQAKIDKREADALREKNIAKKLLDDKLIDQKEYDRRTRAIDEKTRKETAGLKKAQFERDKKAQITSAIMQGAQAILSAISTVPFFPLGLLMAGIAATKTAAQINTIKQSKAPEFAKGGILDGPLHSQGGMPVTDPRTGRKVAEMEGGEAILSRRTYANNRGIIDSLLYSSMHMNGARVAPAWQTSPYFGMDYGALNRTVGNVRRYERGGVFGGDGGSQSVDNTALLQTLNNLNITMQTPTKSYVVISEVNAANETLDTIKSDTVMSRK